MIFIDVQVWMCEYECVEYEYVEYECVEYEYVEYECVEYEYVVAVTIQFTKYSKVDRITIYRILEFVLLFCIYC